jgi:hypothetical protein
MSTDRLPLLAARQLAVLRERHPQWRIGRPQGGWIAARPGSPVVVCSSAYELHNELRRLSGLCQEEPESRVSFKNPRPARGAETMGKHGAPLHSALNHSRRE